MDTLLGCLAVIGIFLGITVACWLVFCGIYAIICLCFGLIFSWPIATGIFLIIGILCFIVSSAKSN